MLIQRICNGSVKVSERWCICALSFLNSSLASSTAHGLPIQCSKIEYEDQSQLAFVDDQLISVGAQGQGQMNENYRYL